MKWPVSWVRTTSQCDTARTGRDACRSYIWAQIISATPKAGGGYSYSSTWGWVFNNIVCFKA